MRRPGTTERVTQCDRAAALIDDVRVEVRPLGEAGQRLGGKRLVTLHHREVVPADACPFQREPCGLYRPDTEQLRLDRRHRASDDAGQRPLAGAPAGFLVAEQQRGSAVVER